MFDRKYIVKIYLGGEGVPTIQYYVSAYRVTVDGHSLTIDGVKMAYGENYYISVEMVD
jgi:hypothetical protein